MISRSSKYSRRINYDAVESLFSTPATKDNANVPTDLADAPEVDLDEKEEWMYTIDEGEKSDGEGLGRLVVEEGGGGGGADPILSTTPTRKKAASTKTGTGTEAEARKGGEVGIESGREVVVEEGEDDPEGEGEGEVDAYGEADATGEDEYGWDAYEGYEQEV